MNPRNACGLRPADRPVNPVKILLVDDSPEFLGAAAEFLSEQAGLEVVGLANSGHEALGRLGRETGADLVLVDLSMPEVNGLEVTRQIKALPRPPRVIILTFYEGAEFRSLAKAAGADQFLTKSDFGDSLLPLIDRMFPDGATEARGPAGAVPAAPVRPDSRADRPGRFSRDRRNGGEPEEHG